MTAADRFRDFLSAIELALRTLDTNVVDLEIGVGAGSGWILDGARAIENVDQDAPRYRIGSGDVQVHFDRRSGIPIIRTMIGRTFVDIIPRRL